MWKHSVPAGVNATDFVLSWISWMQHPKHIPDRGFCRGRISRDRPAGSDVHRKTHCHINARTCVDLIVVAASKRDHCQHCGVMTIWRFYMFPAGQEVQMPSGEMKTYTHERLLWICMKCDAKQLYKPNFG